MTGPITMTPAFHDFSTYSNPASGASSQSSSYVTGITIIKQQQLNNMSRADREEHFGGAQF